MSVCRRGLVLRRGVRGLCSKPGTSTGKLPTRSSSAQLSSAAAVRPLTRNPNLTALNQTEESALLGALRQVADHASFEEARASWFTGLAPAECPGWTADGTLTSLALPNLQTATRRETLDYFNNTWCLSELLFSA